MLHYVSLYLEFIKLRIMGIAEYRKAFIAGSIAQISMYAAEFLLVWVLINKFQTINGWGSFEVLLLYALNLGSYAIAGFFFYNPTTQLSGMIKDGTFDEVLTKPLNSLLYLVCREFNNGYLSHFLLSIFVLTMCFLNFDQQLSFLSFVYLAIVLIGGALIQAAGLIITSVPVFWITENRGLREIFFFQIRSFIRYPISIYHKVIQITLTIIFPFSFINFFPAQYFIHKDDFLMFNHVFQYLTPVVGLICFIVAYRFWFIGINHYKSTGS